MGSFVRRLTLRKYLDMRLAASEAHLGAPLKPLEYHCSMVPRGLRGRGASIELPFMFIRPHSLSSLCLFINFTFLQFLVL